MKLRRMVSSLVAMIALLFSTCNAENRDVVTRPLLWNVANLNKLKKNAALYKKTYKKIIKKGDEYCNLLPIAVADKKNTFAPNEHYYCSLGGYWWEDTLQEGVYIHRDGERNPLTKEYDANRLLEFTDRCVYLSVAYYLTADIKYYDAYVRQVKAWFIDEDTYMYPNFEYAAVVPGKHANKGRPSGMIQAYSFIDVIESILLINSIQPIEEKTLSLVKQWFADFVQWSEESRFGLSMRKSNNNIGIAYDVMLTEMYLFSGIEEKAQSLVDSFREGRLNAQIDQEGKQVAELKRTKAFSYSIYNLSHILDFCFIVSNHWNIDYYLENQEVIDNAFSFLQTFENDPDAFPYQQISDWEKCVQRLHSQINRRERLRNNEMDVFGEPDRLVALNVLLN